MDAEVLRDLRESDVRITVLRDSDHFVSELLGERLGRDDVLPGQPVRLATFGDLAYSLVSTRGS